MMTEDEKFFAWLDGELTPDEAARMEARVAADPALARLAERHRGLAARLQRTLGSLLTEPVPERLLEPLQGRRAEVVDVASRRRPLPWPAMPQWLALAAVLLIGMFIGSLAPSRPGGPIAFEQGRPYAGADLARALDVQLASAPAEGAVRIGLTYRGRSGSYCRTFTYSGVSGLACRDGAHWQLRGMFASSPASTGEYRMATGMDPAFAALVASTIDGQPLDAPAEKAARERGWK